MLPAVSPKKTRRIANPLRNPVTVAAAISFSLTFVGAGVAQLLGWIPAEMMLFEGQVDTAVVLLVVPLCALLLAILAEAMRATLSGNLQPPEPRPQGQLTAWKPGHGEG